MLPGITRKTVIEFAQNLGYEVEERRVSIDELIEAHHNGELTEVFGTGTAAVISPVGQLKYGDTEIVINNNETGERSEEHTSELQSRFDLVCRLLLEKKYHNM